MPNIFSGTNDGEVYASHGSWATLRSAADGDAAIINRTSSPMARVGHSARGGGRYGIQRIFFEFDTSGISVAPLAATLKIYGVTWDSGDVILVRSEQSATLAVGDFDALYGASTALGNSDGSGAGTLAGISGLAYSAEISTWSTSGYNDIPLNATALADMSSLDLFEVALINYDYDYLDILPANNTNFLVGGFFADNSGTSQDPYIDYTAGSAAATNNATFFGANF